MKKEKNYFVIKDAQISQMIGLSQRAKTVLWSQFDNEFLYEEESESEIKYYFNSDKFFANFEENYRELKSFINCGDVTIKSLFSEAGLKEKFDKYKKDRLAAYHQSQIQRLNDSVIQDVLNERGKEYGEFLTQAEISQDLKSYIKPRCKFKDIEREALEMICHKMARIINGNPHNIDSWKDIAGYAMLVVKELEKRNEQVN